jgi:DNA-binding NarL/FixJ family response regulator
VSRFAGIGTGLSRLAEYGFVPPGLSTKGRTVNTPVAIIDPAASFRSGLSRAMSEAGFAPCEVDDVRSWAATDGRRVLLWTIRSPQDWKELSALYGVNAELVMIALLVEATPETYAEALRSGAHAAVAWEASPAAIVKVVAASLEGNVLISREVAHALAANVPRTHDPEWITHEELGWLRALAEGASVHDLARTAAYSERAIYRLLHALYGKMGVSNRTEAIVQAHRLGLLD